MTSFFSVPKGTYDIRMVFDTTFSGFNNYLLDPNFMLPSMGSLIMMVGLKTHMVDIDVGEMFYNIRLYLVLENYCVVDLGYYMGHTKDRQGKPLWVNWVCLMMGLVLFP